MAKVQVQVSFKERMIPCPPDGRQKKMSVLTIEALPGEELPSIKDGETYLLQEDGQDMLLIKVRHVERGVIVPESILIKALISPHTVYVCDILPGGGNEI